MNEKQVIKVTNFKVKDIDFRKLHNTGENFLTESGVYKLILRSHKPEAEDFMSSKLDGMNMKSLLINESGLYRQYFIDLEKD